MTTVKDLLVAARALIANEENWTTREKARDANGSFVQPNSLMACSFCAYGALCRACGSDFADSGDDGAHAMELLDAAANVVLDTANVSRTESLRFSMRPIAALNDILGHAAVLRVYDAAIEKA